jgi:hypothetical protein
VLWRYATYGHRLVDKNIDPKLVGYYRFRGLFTPILFVLSIAVSFVSLAGAEFVWVGMALIPRLSEHYGAR